MRPPDMSVDVSLPALQRRWRTTLTWPRCQMTALCSKGIEMRSWTSSDGFMRQVSVSLQSCSVRSVAERAALTCGWPAHRFPQSHRQQQQRRKFFPSCSKKRINSRENKRTESKTWPNCSSPAQTWFLFRRYVWHRMWFTSSRRRLLITASDLIVLTLCFLRCQNAGLRGEERCSDLSVRLAVMGVRLTSASQNLSLGRGKLTAPVCWTWAKVKINKYSKILRLTGICTHLANLVILIW